MKLIASSWHFCRRVSVILHPDPHERGPITEPVGGLGELGKSLLADASPDRPHHDLVVADSPFGAHPGTSLGIRLEALQVDAVADHLPAAAFQEAAQCVGVLGVLEEFKVGEPDREGLGAIHERPLQPRVLGFGPQAVAGVHHHWDAGQPPRDASHHASFGVVGVQYVQVQPTDGAEQFNKGGQVAAQVPGTGQMGDRDVRDAECLDTLNVRTGGADPEGAVSGGDVLGQFGAQQQRQAHVDRRQVSDTQRRLSCGYIVCPCHLTIIAGFTEQSPILLPVLTTSSGRELWHLLA